MASTYVTKYIYVHTYVEGFRNLKIKYICIMQVDVQNFLLFVATGLEKT